MQQRAHTASQPTPAPLTLAARPGALPDTLARPQFRLAWKPRFAWKEEGPPVAVAEPAPVPMPARPVGVRRLLAALAVRLSTLRGRA